MFFQSPQISFQQPKYPLSIPCADARGMKADYETPLPLHEAACLGDMCINTGKIGFETHARLTATDAKKGPLSGSSLLQHDKSHHRSLRLH